MQYQLNSGSVNPQHEPMEVTNLPKFNEIPFKLLEGRSHEIIEMVLNTLTLDSKPRTAQQEVVAHHFDFAAPSRRESSFNSEVLKESTIDTQQTQLELETNTEFKKTADDLLKKQADWKDNRKGKKSQFA